MNSKNRSIIDAELLEAAEKSRLTEALIQDGMTFEQQVANVQLQNEILATLADANPKIRNLLESMEESNRQAYQQTERVIEKQNKQSMKSGFLQRTSVSQRFEPSFNPLGYEQRSLAEKTATSLHQKQVTENVIDFEYIQGYADGFVRDLDPNPRVINGYIGWHEGGGNALQYKHEGFNNINSARLLMHWRATLPHYGIYELVSYSNFGAHVLVAGDHKLSGIGGIFSGNDALVNIDAHAYLRLSGGDSLGYRKRVHLSNAIKYGWQRIPFNEFMPLPASTMFRADEGQILDFVIQLNVSSWRNKQGSVEVNVKTFGPSAYVDYIDLWVID